jgi:hypothetical protein
MGVVALLSLMKVVLVVVVVVLLLLLLPPLPLRHRFWQTRGWRTPWLPVMTTQCPQSFRGK